MLGWLSAEARARRRAERERARQDNGAAQRFASTAGADTVNATNLACVWSAPASIGGPGHRGGSQSDGGSSGGEGDPCGSADGGGGGGGDC